ncbi:MAG: DEAD/DEAH box helicase family protein, partial [Lentisphaeraceae bacterium]|nr:DEAD/DEAH box helicase family protein [Lentisphaeraceae bacterium]
MTQVSEQLTSGGKGLEKIAKVLPDVSLEKEFEYIIPHELAEQVTLGCRVKIPFGHRQITGYVIEVVDEPEFPREKLKPIISFIGRLIPENLMKLGNWISEYYCASRIHTIRSLLPAPIRNDKVQKKEETVYCIRKKIDVEKLIKKYDGDKRKSSRILILNFLQTHGEATSAYIKKSTGAPVSMIKTMIDEEILESKKVTVERDPFLNEKVVPTKALTLTDEQAESMKLIKDCLDSGQKEVVLVQGVTGCGKTEIYLQAIDHCLAKGQQAIVLV